MSTDLPFEEHVVAAHDVSLRVIAAGPVGAPTIVFVHGYPDTSHVWRPVMAELADRYRVVAYDLRGMGGSTAPRLRRRGWRIEPLREDFTAVIRAVSPGTAVHVVAHDFGSIQTWAFLQHPDTASLVASFTSISGPPMHAVPAWILRSARSTRRLRDVLKQGRQSWYTQFFRIPVLPELVLRLAWRPISLGMLIDSGVAEPSKAMDATRASDLRAGLELYRQTMADAGRVVPDPDLSVPIQVIIPTADRYVTPPLFEDLHEHVPELWRRRVAGGHWLPVTQPQALARWIAELVEQRPTDPAAPVTVPSRSFRRAATDASRPELGDRLVVITGAARGIGRATAFAFAELGAELVLADRDKEGLDRTAELATLAGGTAHVFELDVRNRDEVEAFATNVAATLGVPDIVVNNAGVGAAGPFLATEPEEWDRVLGINLGGVAAGCQAFGRLMVERAEGGHIVNLASAAAFLPSRATPVYGTSKAAVLALSENLRAELAPAGIGVSAICPGVVNTKIIDDTVFSGEADPAAKTAAMVAFYQRRAYPPEKVADAIVDAVRHNRAVVPVTPEAHLARWASRYTPRTLRKIAQVDPTDMIARLRK
jgi:NAD(P)-dependent dehydrogenase (short-subunit alcohol dehydrogenase family)/pimeloyl-ACP methyl ester carboxylesterase